MVELRAIFGLVFGLFVLASQSVAGGLIVFGCGLALGAGGVLVADRLVRKAMRHDHASWVQAGRPERRERDRRPGEPRRRRTDWA